MVLVWCGGGGVVLWCWLWYFAVWCGVVSVWCACVCDVM